jgi:hypothetical protein
MKEYQERILSKIVLPKGEPLFSEMAFIVTMEDECAGAFVSILQQTDKAPTIMVDKTEWEALKVVVDEMLLNCEQFDKDTE